MNNQSRVRRRHLKWRMGRQMQDRRRLNLFLIDRRVRQLAGTVEIVKLDVEHTHDLMTELERKVESLLSERKRSAAADMLQTASVTTSALAMSLEQRATQPNTTQPVGWWAKLKAVMTSKGQP